MSEYKDLENMIEVLQVAIVKQETEEQFFRRSAKHSTSEASRTVFTEIAEEFSSHVRSLEARRQKLVEELHDLKPNRKQQ